MRKIALFLLVALTACEPEALECETGGCSSHLCVPKGSNAMSTCEWRDSYGCYQKFGECGVQEDGQCGWKQTKKLTDCLKNPAAFINTSTQPPQ